ncbi:hypothetical protein D779_1420 [Imhoffiella purpurea]|uniref:Uncharacterized protein n=1 Tax=Imhoffiella purpurea TaxID=1249627 RepID=W9V7F1_9GAMM|nr:hypothetical protein D779_1420 [Imhoffiella purpurea]
MNRTPDRPIAVGPKRRGHRAGIADGAKRGRPGANGPDGPGAARGISGRQIPRLRPEPRGAVAQYAFSA